MVCSFSWNRLVNFPKMSGLRSEKFLFICLFNLFCFLTWLYQGPPAFLNSFINETLRSKKGKEIYVGFWLLTSFRIKCFLLRVLLSYFTCCNLLLSLVWFLPLSSLSSAPEPLSLVTGWLSVPTSCAVPLFWSCFSLLRQRPQKVGSWNQLEEAFARRPAKHLNTMLKFLFNIQDFTCEQRTSP